MVLSWLPDRGLQEINITHGGNILLLKILVGSHVFLRTQKARETLTSNVCAMVQY